MLNAIVNHALATTVDSEIFTRVLFSQNFAYAKFRENKVLAKSNGEITLSFVNMVKSCPSHEFIMSQICF